MEQNVLLFFKKQQSGSLASRRPCLSIITVILAAVLLKMFPEVDIVTSYQVYYESSCFLCKTRPALHSSARIDQVSVFAEVT